MVSHAFDPAAKLDWSIWGWWQSPIAAFPSPKSGAALRTIYLDLELPGVASSQGKGDETEEVGPMCRAPVFLSEQAACTGKGWAPGVMDYIWKNKRAGEQKEEWIDKRLEVRTAQSMPQAEQPLLQPDNAF